MQREDTFIDFRIKMWFCFIGSKPYRYPPSFINAIITSIAFTVFLCAFCVQNRVLEKFDEEFKFPGLIINQPQDALDATPPGELADRAVSFPPIQSWSVYDDAWCHSVHFPCSVFLHIYIHINPRKYIKKSHNRMQKNHVLSSLSEEPLILVL